LNSIIQIRLVRLSRTIYFGNCAITLRNSNENVIYKAVTDTNDSSYLVNHDQVNDIVEEEDWIHGEVKAAKAVTKTNNLCLKLEEAVKASTKLANIPSAELA
jgi:hypothetical protein